MKLRSDMNARTAMVYGGAAFLLMIVGFRSIIATLDPDHVDHDLFVHWRHRLEFSYYYSTLVYNPRS